MWNDVLVVTILHQKSSRNATKLSETELLIKIQGNLVGCYDSIELQNAETEFLADDHGILNQLFADVPASDTFLYCIAGVADMTASAYVVRVQDIQAEYLSRLFVLCHTSI